MTRNPVRTNRCSGGAQIRVSVGFAGATNRYALTLLLASTGLLMLAAPAFASFPDGRAKSKRLVLLDEPLEDDFYGTTLSWQSLPR